MKQQIRLNRAGNVIRSCCKLTLTNDAILRCALKLTPILPGAHQFLKTIFQLRLQTEHLTPKIQTHPKTVLFSIWYLNSNVIKQSPSENWCGFGMAYFYRTKFSMLIRCYINTRPFVKQTGFTDYYVIQIPTVFNSIVFDFTFRSFSFKACHKNVFNGVLNSSLL